jgi:nucleoside-triphosphatase THEP1
VLAYEGFNSPGSLLAKYFFQENQTSGLYLLTGPSGSGKTTWCLELIEKARVFGIDAVGVISPPVLENGQRVGIDLVDIANGEVDRLASRRVVESGLVAPHGPTSSNIVTLGWQFNNYTLEKGNRILTHLTHLLEGDDKQGFNKLVIVDELGPLEFIRREGWVTGIELISQRNYRLACVVVRPELLPQALDLWPWAKSLKFTLSGCASGSRIKT